MVIFDAIINNYIHGIAKVILLTRSEEVNLFTVTLQKDCAWKSVYEIGKLNALHFIDVNRKEQIYSRENASSIRRCEELLRKLNYLKSVLADYKIRTTTPSTIEEYFTEFENISHAYHKDIEALIDDIDKELLSKEQFLSEQTKSLLESKVKRNRCLQHNYVLKKLHTLINTNQMKAKGQDLDINTPLKSFNVIYIAGFIRKEDQLRFNRTIFRVTRGNAFLTFQQSDKDNVNGTDEVFYTIMYKESDEMRRRLMKICESLNATYFEIEKDYEGKILENTEKAEDTKSMEKTTTETIINKCNELKKPMKGGKFSYIRVAEIIIQKEAMIYTTLNMMKTGPKTYKGLAWCTKTNEDLLTKLTSKLSEVKDFIPPRFKKMKKTSLIPPTATYTNEFIAAFQSIVDTYGIPNYQEANPALFTIITFPFMFGIMFGDFCHGLVLTTIASYVCLERESLEKSKSMLSALIPARYLLLFMGLFASFCGFIYNDFASLPLNLFKSCYTNNLVDGTANKVDNCVYAFGLDYKWYSSENELAYINSFKMKISVVFGVAQMLLGVILKGANAIHFKKPFDFFFEFIPQLLFLGGLFGYMIIVIFIKWGTDWRNIGNNAPSVITFLIDLVLNLGEPGPTPFYGDGTLQKKIAVIVLTLSFICVPWMLVLKPMLIKREHLAQQENHPQEIEGEEMQNQEPRADPDSKEQTKEPVIEDKDVEPGKLMQQQVKNALETSVLLDKPEKFDFSEIFVHQMIECIEFVLGTVSNTASYLRLWALSLAHAQLSKVFFDKVLAGAIRANSSIGVMD